MGNHGRPCGNRPFGKGTVHRIVELQPGPVKGSVPYAEIHGGKVSDSSASLFHAFPGDGKPDSRDGRRRNRRYCILSVRAGNTDR